MPDGVENPSGSASPAPNLDQRPGGDAERAAAAAAAAAPDLTALLRQALLGALAPAAPGAAVPEVPVFEHPDRQAVTQGEYPSSGHVSADNPVPVNNYPRPPSAQVGPPQFFPLFNETYLKLPTAQQKELEVLYAVASYQSDQVQVLHECAVASGYPLLAGLRDDANGILTLVKKRINALTVMAAKGTAAGIYVADTTINPLANSLDDPESRAALQQYHTQELRRDLNTAVWGGRGRGNGRGARGGGAYSGYGGAYGAPGAAAAGGHRPAVAPAAAGTGTPAQTPHAGSAGGRGGRGRGRGGRFGGVASN